MKLESMKDYLLARLRNELSHELYYHGVHHTLDVLNVAEKLIVAEGVSQTDADLIRTSVLLHDSGFLIGYENHEEKGCAIARDLLPSFGFQPDEIQRVCGMIMATRVPQKPTNLCERITCDADLDYLGRADFFQISETLRLELLAFGTISEKDNWYEFQLKFLEQHQFCCQYSIETRSHQKQIYLNQVRQLAMR